ncbi:hypothetical protein V1525DRAFT_411515 [Lipomyces kononenkoae]|uniref:Uncharacterized protein n=1 Tax=Lipomyces kononenkoae TaxID=34357 RepID=A0ACC3SUE4_LIPKO
MSNHISYAEVASREWNLPPEDKLSNLAEASAPLAATGTEKPTASSTIWALTVCGLSLLSWGIIVAIFLLLGIGLGVGLGVGLHNRPGPTPTSSSQAITAAPTYTHTATALDITSTLPFTTTTLPFTTPSTSATHTVDFSVYSSDSAINGTYLTWVGDAGQHDVYPVFLGDHSEFFYTTDNNTVYAGFDDTMGNPVYLQITAYGDSSVVLAADNTTSMTITGTVSLTLKSNSAITCAQQNTTVESIPGWNDTGAIPWQVFVFFSAETAPADCKTINIYYSIQ